jgi:hypothetical protein
MLIASFTLLSEGRRCPRFVRLASDLFAVAAIGLKVFRSVAAIGLCSNRQENLANLGNAPSFAMSD